VKIDKKSLGLPRGQERRERWLPGFSDGKCPSSPFAREWLGARLCRMMEGTRSALPSPPCCEDSSEVFVQCGDITTPFCCRQEKILSATTQGLNLVQMGDAVDFFSVGTAICTLQFNFFSMKMNPPCTYNI